MVSNLRTLCGTALHGDLKQFKPMPTLFYANNSLQLALDGKVEPCVLPLQRALTRTNSCRQRKERYAATASFPWTLYARASAQFNERSES